MEQTSALSLHLPSPRPQWYSLSVVFFKQVKWILTSSGPLHLLFLQPRDVFSQGRAQLTPSLHFGLAQMSPLPSLPIHAIQNNLPCGSLCPHPALSFHSIQLCCRACECGPCLSLALEHKLFGQEFCLFRKSPHPEYLEWWLA